MCDASNEHIKSFELWIFAGGVMEKLIVVAFALNLIILQISVIKFLIY